MSATETSSEPTRLCTSCVGEPLKNPAMNPAASRASAVDRLEKRGWLARESIGGVYRYRPTLDRPTAEARLAAGFVAGFFGGSPTQLVQSLVGSEDVSLADIDRLQRMLAEAKRRKARGGEQSPKGGRS